MNKAYRLIWSKAKDAWVIVAEIVKGNGGPPPVTVKAAVVAAAIVLMAANVDALPVGQQVVSGTATFATAGNTLTVTNSPNAIINWQGFSIAAGERTTFSQQNAASAVLNRVTGAYRSDIFGMLDSNGKVFLINPNGIIFGSGSQVNVAGLVASSLGISNENFLAGKYDFTAGSSAGAVQNQGAITTTAGGMVWLISPNVENSGLITTPSGSVMLAAGQSVNMVDPLRPEIAVVVSAPTDQAVNMGTVLAQGGSAGIFGGLINQQGVINANSAVAGPGGRIFLKSTVSTTLGADSVISANALDNGDGGKIVVWSDGHTEATGNLSAKAGANGGNGGFIETSGKTVDFSGIKVNASAPKGNGGLWLIDPNDLDIDAAGAAAISGALNTGTSVEANTVTAAFGTVTDPSGFGDIVVTGAIFKDAGGDASLTLKAERSITINNSITSISGRLGVTLNAHYLDNAAEGFVSIQNNITTNGGNLVIGGGTNPITTAAIGVNGSPGVHLGSGYAINAGAGNITINGQGAAGVSFDGGHGVFLEGPITAANITLNGTGGAGGYSYSGGTYNGKYGGYGVKINDAIIATGNVSITGKGGAGGSVLVEGYNGLNYVYGGAGGVGINVSSSGSISADGTVSINGTGGKGGDAKIVIPTGGGYSYGGDAFYYGGGYVYGGGKGGVGVYVESGAAITSNGGLTKEIRLIGVGGLGGDAHGGDFSYPLASNGNGGNAQGGNGGSGISHQGSIEATAGASIYMEGTGASGGKGTGGYGGFGYDGGTPGYGGFGLGGYGGLGIEVNGGTITTSSGNITLKGYGGAGGDGLGGTGGQGSPSGSGGNGGRVCPEGCYGPAVGGNGITLNSAAITSDSGLIDLHGEGGAGGKGTGGDGYLLAPGYGGLGYGGDGGAGFYMSGGYLDTGGNIKLSGIGGVGGLAVDGNGIPSSNGGSAGNSVDLNGAYLYGVNLDIAATGGLNITSGLMQNISGTLALSNSGSGDLIFIDSGGGLISMVNSAAGGAVSLTTGYMMDTLQVVGIASSNGQVTINSDTDIVFNGAVNAGTGSVTVTSAGSINGQAGVSSINAGSATLSATNGIGTAATPFVTAVSSLSAINNDPNSIPTPSDVNISNTGPLTLVSIATGSSPPDDYAALFNNAGSINLDNVGAVIVAGNVLAKSGTSSNISITAHSPLTINSGVQVSASGGVTLVAGVGPIGSTSDYLLVGGDVTALNGNIILQAGNSVTRTGTLLAPNGSILIQENMNPQPPPLTTQMAALLPGVNDVVTGMGKESTDLSEEDEEDDESTGEGGQDGTEFKSLPYCN